MDVTATLDTAEALVYQLCGANTADISPTALKEVLLGALAQIEAVAEAYGAEEVFLVNILHSHAARRRSYELIAEAFR